MKAMLINYNYDELIDIKDISNQLVSSYHIILIKKFPIDDSILEDFISKIGKPILETRNNKGKSVFDVKVSTQNNLFKSFANSNLRFPLHTDCASFETIPNCIGMLCAKADSQKGGISNFAILSDILKKLDTVKIDELNQKNWSFIQQQRPILVQENNDYKICYDRVTMESFSEINQQGLKQLDELDELFESCSFQIHLEEGDLIIFRNDLILHGREGFDLDSDRLIKRIRFSVSD